MLEKHIERKLGEAIRKREGLYFKFVSPGNAGVPDRIAILPGGRIYFIELKTDTGQVSALQARQLSRLRAVGADARVLHGPDEVNDFLREVMPNEV